jgi:hypothetical protein
MTGIELATRIFVVLHLIGLASLLGGFLVQMKDLKNGGKILPAMLHGAWLLVISGFALVGLVGMSGEEHVDNILLAVKSIVITAIFFLAYGFSKKDLSTKKWVVPTIALLTILNTCVAVIGGIVQSGAASGM